MSAFLKELNKELENLNEKLNITISFDDQSFKLRTPRVTTTDYEYDDKNRVKKSYSDMYGLNTVTEFEYDDNGNLIKYSTVTNNNPNTETVTTKEYDDKNRILSSTSDRYIETYTYTENGFIQVTKDIEEETETTEEFILKDGNQTLLRMERFSVQKGYIDKKIESEIGDGWTKVSYYEDIKQDGNLVRVHSEKINDDNMPIEFTDIQPGNDNEIIEFKVQFTYAENGKDITNIKTYANDELTEDNDTEITINEDGSREIYSHGIRTKKYSKDGYNIMENFYEADYSGADIEYKINITSEDNKFTLEKTVMKAKPGIPSSTAVIVSSTDYNIDLVNLKLIDINIKTDNKKYEFGSDLHGGPSAYASVTTYTENGDLDNCYNVEYTRTLLDDPLTNYLSGKVYQFIEENEEFKQLLELAEVNYEELKK